MSCTTTLEAAALNRSNDVSDKSNRQHHQCNVNKYNTLTTKFQIK